MSEEQQLRAVNARQLRLAESLEEQQVAIRKTITSLQKEGNTAKAKEVLDEAVSLGIFTVDGDKVKKTTGEKKSMKSGALKRFLESLAP